MEDTTLHCDQAIFTSIRTPMGEGYRVVAASRGLRPDEKQVITRCSPSHEGLCAAPPTVVDEHPSPVAAAFFALPTGRFCVSVACFAGAEHTGRGGQRIYTTHVVFDETGFARCAYNPFHVVRAMIKADLVTPVLKPPTVLPEVDLPLEVKRSGSGEAHLHPALGANCRRRILETLLEHGHIVVNVDGGWIGSAEALLLGLPGPMRTEISLDLGMRFSVGRCHNLHLLHDESPTTRRRVAGQPVEYLDPAEPPADEATPSAWLQFVERRWRDGDMASLARRTSRPFADFSPTARERMGRILNDIDDVDQFELMMLLERAAERVKGIEPEQDLVDEFLAVAQPALRSRLRAVPAGEAKVCWDRLVSIWRSSDKGTAFAQPLLESLLKRMREDDIVGAAGAAVDVAREIPPAAMRLDHTARLDEFLTYFADWAARTDNLPLEPFQQLCVRWANVRPACPMVQRLQERAAALMEAAAASSKP